MQDTFFTQQNCDRCNADLEVRTMSWFTSETICGNCSNEERELRKTLPNNGRKLEGCGYIPGDKVGTIDISAMFHDDSFEGYNFFQATEDDSTFIGGGEEFKQSYPELVKQVEAAMKDGKNYISLDDGTEIQWG